MRILFTAHQTHESKGIGGHFRTLGEILRMMARNGHDVSVVYLSENGISPVLRGLPCSTTCVPFSFPFVGNAYRALRHAVSSYSPDIVHCFDLRSLEDLVFSRAAATTAIVLNKCGGPCLKGLHTFPKSVVVFSGEDLEWFDARRSVSGVTRQIPNRVSDFEVDVQRSKALRRKVRSSHVILRVCRIGPYYKDSILSGIELVRRLRAIGIDVRLAVIGAVECEGTLSLLKKYAGDAAVFLSESYFYDEGRLSLGGADIVLATGRGAMEACFVGVPVLVPRANAVIPVFMGDSNIEKLLFWNFSHRFLDETSERAATEAVAKCLTNKSSYSAHGQKAKLLYDQFFRLDNAYVEYLGAYNDARPLSKTEMVAAHLTGTKRQVWRTVRDKLLHSFQA